jgi:hypothetical protein
MPACTFNACVESFGDVTLNVQMQQHRITLDSADKAIDIQLQGVHLV